MKQRLLKPKVSIIVLNYNGLHFLKKCLPTIKSQTYKKIETIITDNNSSDGSQSFIKKLKWPKLVANKDNYGYAGANNIAAKMATGELLFFLNNDTELLPNTIEELVKKYQPKSILAAAQIVLANKKRDKKGSAGPGMDIFGYSYVDLDVPSTKPFYVDGAGIFIGKNDFFRIGKFDEKLFIFHEDVDLSWRAQIFGYKLVQCPEAKFYHVSGGNVSGGSRVNDGRYTASYNRLYLNQKNVVRNLIKNYSLPFLLVVFPTLLVAHLTEVVVLTLLGQLNAVSCYIKAYWWNILNISDTLRLRAWIQKRRKVSDLSLLTKMYFAYSKLTALYRLGIPKFK